MWEVGEAERWRAQRGQELDARLASIRMPIEAVPMVAAAQLDRELTASLTASIRRVVQRLRTQLGTRVEKSVPPGHVLASCQAQADGLFATLDLLTDAVAQRADSTIGVRLAGAEVLARAALAARVPGYRPPPPLCYLDRGRGGEIRRARVRLGGGVTLSAALIRVGLHSLATRLSTVLHEAGHQVAADLGLLSEARDVIRAAARRATGSADHAARWGQWSGELMADAWSACVGGGVLALDGLQRLLAAMPAPWAYLVVPGAVHPPGMVRVSFAVALARQLEPAGDPVLDLLERRWNLTYHEGAASAPHRDLIRQLTAAAAPVARALFTHRFSGLGGEPLHAAGHHVGVRAPTIAKLIGEGPLDARALAALSPLVAIAAVCRARLLGALSAHSAEVTSAELLEQLALRRDRHDVVGNPPLRQLPFGSGAFSEVVP